MSHKHKVTETKKRSLLKAVSGRIIEIIVGALVFGTILSFLGFPSAYEIGLALNLVEEIICFGVTYLTDRAWNRIQWGRKVTDIVWNRIQWGKVTNIEEEEEEEDDQQ